MKSCRVDAGGGARVPVIVYAEMVMLKKGDVDVGEGVAFQS